MRKRYDTSGSIAAHNPQGYDPALDGPEYPRLRSPLPEHLDPGPGVRGSDLDAAARVYWATAGMPGTAGHRARVPAAEEAVHAFFTRLFVSAAYTHDNGHGWPYPTNRYGWPHRASEAA